MQFFDFCFHSKLKLSISISKYILCIGLHINIVCVINFKKFQANLFKKVSEISIADFSALLSNIQTKHFDQLHCIVFTHSQFQKKNILFRIKIHHASFPFNSCYSSNANVSDFFLKFPIPKLDSKNMSLW